MSILKSLSLSGSTIDNSQSGSAVDAKIKLDLNDDNIKALAKDAVNLKNPAAGDALDALVQLIAHNDGDIRQSALREVRSLPDTLTGEVNERLSALFEIAKITRKKKFLTPEAVTFTAYHVAKRERDLGNNGSLYQDALGAWNDVVKNSSDNAIILSAQSHSSLIPDAEIGAFADLEPKDKAEKVRKSLNCETLLHNDRLITIGELNSYAFLNKEQDNAGCCVKYNGAFSHQSGSDSRNSFLHEKLNKCLDSAQGSIAICSILIKDHYVHVVRREGNICILDTLGMHQPDYRSKALQDIKDYFFSKNCTVTHVYENIQSYTYLPNAEGVGLPNACAIFGPALQDNLQEQEDRQTASLQTLIKRFVNNVKNMDQSCRQDMNDTIRGKLLSAAASTATGEGAMSESGVQLI